MQQGCILESGQMFLWIGGTIKFYYGWGRQFTSNSSTITSSVKGTPACSSAGAPSPGAGHHAIPFGEIPVGLAIEVVRLLPGQGVVWQVLDCMQACLVSPRWDQLVQERPLRVALSPRQGQGL
ncbi:UNVERIFIED_CONTAM: hypothetical protein Slati_2265800 [Sesamum latifolium]|uniref:Uncharacterized protein n=1 Tax=Sesamum latifolium TaxID=2727402 RepID=A0AAW2WVY6_9LAMI